MNQAVNAFKMLLPDSAPVNLVPEPHEDGRVYVSTYQTMVGKIDEYRSDGTRRCGVGHFDLVVIDEAHRSVYRKYGGIFEYFDNAAGSRSALPWRLWSGPHRRPGEPIRQAYEIRCAAEVVADVLI